MAVWSRSVARASSMRRRRPPSSPASWARPICSRWRVETKDGLTMSANQHPDFKADAVVCVRPEAIQISANAGAAANVVAGRVLDAVYTAGSLRYRVEVAPGRVVLVRRPLQRQTAVIEVGSPVYLAWDIADTILIPNP